MAQPPTGNPAFFGQKVSKPGVNVLNAGPTDLVYQNDYTTTTYYDSKNSRILLGQLPDGTYGMLVSKPGVDVTTASLGQLIFSSDNSFTVALAGSYTFPLVAVTYPVPAEANAIIPHGLGFFPGFNTFVELPAASDQQSLTTTTFVKATVDGALLYTGVGTGGLSGVILDIVATTENLYLEAYYLNGEGSGTLNFPALTIYYFVYSSAVQ